jgi:DNA-binding NarL/FixJ family response regulator
LAIGTLWHCCHAATSLCRRLRRERLGAAPELARIDSLMKEAPSGHSHRLTSRELQVHRLVAAGEDHKAIASKLFLIKKTGDWHVSNIFTKLDVPRGRRCQHKLI